METCAKTEAVEWANAYLSNAGLPTYSALLDLLHRGKRWVEFHGHHTDVDALLVQIDAAQDAQI